jgi:hypothetical protein
MIQLFHSLIPDISTAFHMLCFIGVWTLIGFFSWSVWLAAKDGIATVKRLHQIPCSDCRFFTGSYQLKCPVHPKAALTEEAINCCDYYPNHGRASY